MKSSYTKTNKIYDELEREESVLEKKKIYTEAINEKIKSKLIRNRIVNLLGFLGLIDVTKTTQSQLQYLLIRNPDLFSSVFRFDEIKREYYRISNEQQVKNKLIYYKTTKEIAFKKILKERTRMKTDATVLFGNSTFDLYVHALGIAIEIDGDVHDHEAKMIKDEIKINTCSLLGIKLMSISNKDIKSKTIKSFLDQITTLPTLNSIKRREIFLGVMIYGIMVHNPKFIENYFGVNMNQLDLIAINGIEKMLSRKAVSGTRLGKLKKVTFIF